MVLAVCLHELLYKQTNISFLIVNLLVPASATWLLFLLFCLNIFKGKVIAFGFFSKSFFPIFGYPPSETVGHVRMPASLVRLPHS